MVGRGHNRGDKNLPMDPLRVVEMATPLRRMNLVTLRLTPMGVKVGYGPTSVKMVICPVNLLLSAL